MEEGGEEQAGLPITDQAAHSIRGKQDPEGIVQYDLSSQFSYFSGF